MRFILISSCAMLLATTVIGQAVERRPGVRLPKPGRYLIAAVEHDFKLPNDVVLPSKVDMRPYFPLPGDQHAQASCTAWAMSYGLATFRDNWERGHRPDRSQPPDLEHVYSPGFLFNMVKQYEQPDTSARACLFGVDLGATFTIACEWGNSPWAVYPYDSRNDGCRDHVDTTVIVRAQQHKLPRAVALWHSNKGGGPTELPFDPVQWKYHLARKEPVVVSISIDCSFTYGGDSAWREHRPFVWDVDSVGNDDACSGGHVMVCTGYTDRDSTFTFLNSFGQQWGDSGYVKLTYRTLRSIYITREAYIFSQQWWRALPVPVGKPVQETPVVDSTLSASIKPGQVHLFHDLEVRVVTISPDERNIVVQFTDTAHTKPVTTMEFPRGVKRSFLYEEKLWSFTYFEPGVLRSFLGNALPFVLTVDGDDDEKLEEAMHRHYEKWRASEVQP